MIATFTPDALTQLSLYVIAPQMDHAHAFDSERALETDAYLRGKFGAVIIDVAMFHGGYHPTTITSTCEITEEILMNRNRQSVPGMGHIMKRENGRFVPIESLPYNPQPQAHLLCRGFVDDDGAELAQIAAGFDREFGADLGSIAVIGRQTHTETLTALDNTGIGYLVLSRPPIVAAKQVQA